jgi:apolipoprotein N-acyltransferase
MLIQIFGGAGDDAVISIDGKNLFAAIPPEMLERFGYAFFAPLVMVIVGAKIAPKFKFQIAIALAVLWGIIFGASMTIAISRGQYSDWGWLRFAITCVLGIVGVALGLFLAHKAQKETKLMV